MEFTIHDSRLLNHDIIVVCLRAGVDPATGQRGNGATVQRGNPATVQPGNPATVQRGNGATVQPGNPATVQRGNGATGQRGNPRPLNHHAAQRRNLRPQRRDLPAQRLQGFTLPRDDFRQLAPG